MTFANCSFHEYRYKDVSRLCVKTVSFTRRYRTKRIEKCLKDVFFAAMMPFIINWYLKGRNFSGI